MDKKTQVAEHGFKLMPVLCMDLDGTVRRSKSGKTFIEGPDDIELMPGVDRVIWRYKGMGYIIIGISNQAGVAHGFKTHHDISDELDATIKLFKSNPFTAVKCCMSDGKGNAAPYNVRSLCRKPDIGMLAVIEGELWGHGVIADWDNSLFVGDRPEDEECAKRASIPFRHIDSFLNEPHTFEIC
jgi:D-glycero-D-manno-heptose 1,7-bisphosphate phosphatase